MKNLFTKLTKVGYMPILILIFIILITNQNSNAQVGTPTYLNSAATGASNSFPLNTTTSNKVQWIFAPGAFTTLGDGAGVPLPAGHLITKIYIRFSATVNAVNTYTNFTISMGQNVGAINNYPETPTTPGTFNTGLTQAFYQASGFAFTGITGGSMYGITLQTPFLYDPTLALIVEVKSDNATSGGNSVANVTTTGISQRMYGNYTSPTSTVNTGLTPMGFDVIPSTPCPEPPTPGDATATPSVNVCPGANVNLNLNGAIFGLGQTYQWESSSSMGGPYTPISGIQSSPAFTVNPLVNTWYRCAVTCGATTLYSTPVEVTVQNPFAGIFTIDNTIPTGGSNFNSFTDAVNAMNSCGITGPVVFNVAAGQSFNENVPAITVNSTSVNTVIFQKSGGGSNPVIIPTGTTLTTDAGITINGSDYITFDGIDVTSSGTAVEFGFRILATSATNGAQNNTVKNCRITLNRNNTASRGIFQTNNGFTPTSIDGTNSNNTYKNLEIFNVYAGIHLTGASTITFPDRNNKIITDNCSTMNIIGNPLTPFDIGGGFSATQTWGIRLTNQAGFTVSNNSIRNVSGNTTTDGIFIETYIGVAGFLASTLSNNIINGIRLNTSVSTQVSGIRLSHTTLAVPAGTVLQVYNNSVSNITSAYSGGALSPSTTGGIKGISIAGTGGSTLNQTYEIINNSVSIDGSGSLNLSNMCFQITATAGTGPKNIVRNNIFANFTGAQGVTARHLGVFTASVGGATALGPAGSAFTNNDIWIANDAGVSGFTARGSTTQYNGVSAFQTTYTQASANIEVDPMFFSNNSNLHATNLALDGTGAAYPGYLTIDLDCAQRIGPADIGAYNVEPCLTGAPTASISGFVCTGSTLTASTNAVNPSYQWLLNGSPVGDAATLVANLPGDYTVIIWETGTSCVNTSSPFTVLLTPAITVIPSSETVCDGETVSLQAVVTNTPPLGYTVSSITHAPLPVPATPGPVGDDASQGPNNIGFTFNFFGIDYTQFGISTNGNIQLGAGTYSTSFSPVAIPSAAVPNNYIAAPWADLNTNFAGSPNTITWGVTGSAPNRILVVSYNGLGSYGTGANCTSQILLYETTNVIEVHVTSYNENTISKVLGIENSTGTAGYAAPGRNATTTPFATPEAWRFEPIVPGYTYSWTPPGGLSATNISNPVATPPIGTTVYTVTVTDNGCSGTASTTLTNLGVANPEPTAAGDSICEGETTILTATGIGTMRWYNAPTGGTLLHTGASFTVSPTTTTTYYVEDFNGNCPSDRVAVPVVVTPAPVLNPTAAPSVICNGQSSQLDAGTFLDGILTTPLNQNNGSSATGFDITNISTSPITLHYFTFQSSSTAGTTGLQSIYYKPSAMNCVFPTNVTTAPGWVLIGSVSTVSNGPSPAAPTLVPLDVNITIPPGATYAFAIGGALGQSYTSGTSGCPIMGSTAHLNVREGFGGTLTGTIANRRWNGSVTYQYGDNNLQFSWTPAASLNNPTIKEPIATPTTTTTYTVTATNIAGCTASDTVTVNVVQLPPAPTASAANSVCGYGQVTLNATGTGNPGSVLNWYDVPAGGSPIGTGSSIVVTINTTTTYYVAEYDGSLCESTRTPVNAVSTPAPAISLTSSLATICDGSTTPAVLTTTSPNSNYTYAYTPTSGLNPSNGLGAVVSALPASSTTYTVTATDAGTNCVNTASVFIGVGTTPTITSVTASPTNLCTGDPSILTVSANIGLPPVVFSENFEGASLPAGWASTGLWHVTSSCATGTPPNPSYWAYYGVDGTCNFDSPPGTTNSGNLTSPSIVIPSTASTSELQFHFIYNGEDGTPPGGFDNAALLISQNAGPFVQVLALSGPGFPNNIWAQASVNLAPYIGSTIQLRWNFNTVDGIGNTGLGLQVDNIIIEAEQAGLIQYTWAPSGTLNTSTGPTVIATPTTGGPNVYTVTATNEGCFATASVTITAVQTPPAPVCSAPAVCGQGVTNLTATGTGGTLFWTEGIGGPILATGASYSPYIYNTTTYNVRENPGGVTQNVGLSATAPGGVAFASASINYQTFNVLTSKGIIINTVDIVPNAATPLGTPVSIVLEDNTGLQVGPAVSTVTTTQGTVQTITLNMFVPQGTAWRLRSPQNPNMQYHQSGFSNPYTIPDVVSITGWGPPNATTLYVFYYNWSVEVACFSPACSATANVNPAPPLSISTSGTPAYCDAGSVSLTAGGDPSWTNFSWAPATGLNTTSGATVIASPSVTTTYIVTANDGITGGCIDTAQVTVTVNTGPSVLVTSTAPEDTICVGVSFQFNAIAGSASAKQFGSGHNSALNTAAAVYNGGNANVRTQILYTAAELNAAGLTGPGAITDIAWEVANKLSTGTYSGFTIRMANVVNAPPLTNTYLNPAFTTVFVGNVTTSLGWNTHVFNTPFIWDGVSNILVDICNGPSPPFGFDQVYTSPTPTAQTIYITALGCAATTGAANVNRPNTRMTGGAVTYSWNPGTELSSTTVANPIFTGATTGNKNYTLTVTDPSNGCTSTASFSFVVSSTPKIPVIVFNGDSAFCNNGTPSMSATGSTGSFQWQSSPDGITFTDIPSATNTTYNQAPAINISTYYRVYVHCGDTSYSNILFALVNNPMIVTTANDTVCGVGEVCLSATTNNPAYAAQWFGQAVGGVPLGSGNTFCTNITGTTTFYVQATTDPNAPVDTVSSIPYAPLSPSGSPTVLASGGINSSPGNFTGSLDDGTWTNIVLPFPVEFFGQNNTAISVSTNGFITFTATSTLSGCCSGQILPSATTPNDVVALAWEDHLLSATGTIDYFTVGVAPNRKFVIRYTDVPRFGGTGSPLTGQIVLNEGSVAIQMHITSAAAGIGDLTTQGVENATGTIAAVVPGRNSTVWSATNEGWQFFGNTACSSSPRVAVTGVSETPPLVTISSSVPVSCGGDPVTLTASSPNDPNYVYTWQPGNLTGPVQTVTPTQPTDYILTAFDATLECTLIDTFSLDVVDPPTVNVTANQTIFCDIANAQLDAGASASGTLTTLFNSNNGQSGNYFNVVAINNVTITGFDGNFASGSNNNVSIYYRPGGYQGFTNNAAGWTLVGTVNNVVSLGTNIPTPIPLPVNVTIPAGQTYGWLIISLNTTSMQYTGAAGAPAEGAVWASDANLQVLAGLGTQNPPFSGTNFGGGTASRCWNGKIYYGSGGSNVYNWTPNTGLSSSSIANPVATPTTTTTYTLIVTDTTTGCTSTDSITIIVDPTPTPVITSTIANPVCQGQLPVLSSQYSSTNGYQFNWNSGLLATDTIEASIPGDYTLIVTSPNGCTSNLITYTVEVATIFVDFPTTTDVLCNGDSTGTATINAFGTLYDPSGNVTFGPWSYSANGEPFQSSSTLTGLWAGNHNITVYDSASGCSVNIVALVTEPPLLVAGPVVINQNVSCNGLSDGSATASASGGVGPYIFNWNTPIPKQGEIHNEIPAGTWTITVTDANGCTATTTVTITEPDELVASASQTEVSCYGLSDGSATISVIGGTLPYSGTGLFTGLLAGVHEFIVTDANGCTDTIYVTITEPIEVTISASSTNVSCYGLADGTISATASLGASITVNGLPYDANATYGPGIYTVVATAPDGNNIGVCTASMTVSITEPIEVTINTTHTNVTCNGFANGTITAVGSVGSSITVDGQPYNPAAQYGPGTYTVVASAPNGNNNGICTASMTVTITQPPVLNVTIASTNSTYWSANNGTATATATGGTPLYSYLWSTSQTTAGISGLAPGSYTVTVTDANGCVTSATVLITEPAFLCNGSSTHIKWGPGGWGGTPNGANPATYLYANFAAAFPNGLTIGHPLNTGCNRSMKWTTPQAITAFLPSTGTPRRLDAGHKLNFTAVQYGNTFAAQVVALTINVVFDAYDPNFSPASTVTFGDMIICISGSNTQFNGWTVNQLLIEANNVLACGASKSYISALNDAIDKVNNQNNATCCPTAPIVKTINPGTVTMETGSKLNVYPNPTSGKITVNFKSENQTPTNIIVMDIRGRVVINLNNEEGNSFIREIDLSMFENGLYIMSIYNNDELLKSIKVIKTE